MWRRLIDDWLATPPAIWGKLPDHADFVRSGMRHGELEAWTTWLDEQGRSAPIDDWARAVAVPVAFVLPPGTLAFAPRRFVLGVIAPSVDRVGRHHPLVVYQKAHPRWVRRHFEAQHRRPCDWQFWLARAVARHMRVDGLAMFAAMEGTLRALWRDRSAFLKTDLRDDAAASQACRMHALLDRFAGPAPQDDPSARLHGVRYLPWADWPERLRGSAVESAFWQQDAQGRFVGAATRLQKLWSNSP